jgi:hypothetical protein
MAIYETQSVPPRYLAVIIDRFPESQNFAEHLRDITRTIPNYDPNNVTEDEVVPGQKVKLILSTQNPTAFWTSRNLAILITFMTPSSLDRMLIGQWLTLHPSNADSGNL